MSAENSPDLFSSLLSNPALLSGIAQLLSSSQNASATETAKERENVADSDKASPQNETQAQKSNAPDLSGIIGAALANPQLLSALPKMMGALSGAFSEQDNTAPSSQSEPAAEAAGAFNYQSSPPVFSQKSSLPRPAKVTDRRSALLLALKPYMSHDKAEAIDTIVRIIEIMSLIK